MLAGGKSRTLCSGNDKAMNVHISMSWREGESEREREKDRKKESKRKGKNEARKEGRKERQTEIEGQKERDRKRGFSFDPCIATIKLADIF